MGKSSSSSKKINHSRDSSKLRSVKKKKTKINKSKKIRLIEDSSEESESSGSDSSLYSSSEDDEYRRKKKRRSKVSKKRSRKRYSSSETESESESESDDDDTRLLKKKKRSKRKEEQVRKTKKKKISSKKKRKRDSSSSSTSSESNSSRDNRSEDDTDSDGKRRSRVRGRIVSKVKASPRIIRDESEGDSELDECWQRGDEFMLQENPRSLKSIVVVVSNTYDNDERVDVHDDLYLTHEGNIDSGNREFGYNVESDEIDGETTKPYSRTHAADYGYETVGYDHFWENNKSEISKSFHIDNSMKEDDLEAILKKRALENLKRFRGVTQRSEIERKVLSSVSEGEPLQIESKKVEESQYYGLMEQRLCDPAGSKDLEASEKLIQVSNAKNTGTVLVNFASQQDQHSDGTAKVKASSGISCTTKRKLVRPVLGKDLNLSSRKEAVGSQNSELVSINDSTIGMNCRETENGGENIEPVNLSSHADSETLEEYKGDSQSEQKTIDETKDELQYEQKTMTVMRGGEMVQVSYKVYIPKKTSSLGRRKLKR